MKENLAGSLQPIDAGKGKWWNGLGALEISQLEALGKDINKAVDTTVKQVARGKIKVGKLLLEARGLFIEDQAFGKWRKENTMVQSKQHAHYLMQVAERFGDAPKLIEGANYSVLQELVLADQQDIEWIEAKIDAGDEMPTVVEVRKKVKGTSMKAKLGSNHKPTGSMISPHEHINKIVQMSLTLRIKSVVERGIKGIEGDFIILGMDPDPQCPCHPDVLEAIETMWEGSTSNLDEQRAVVDSVKRVMAEFEGWYTR